VDYLKVSMFVQRDWAIKQKQMYQNLTVLGNNDEKN
jgi:hypothetical protein